MNERFFPLLLAFPLVACGAVVHQPLTPPEKGGPAWTEVTSEHFTVKTDLDKDEAQHASAKLEEMFTALADFGFPSSQRPKVHIDVVYFRSHDDYAELAPKLTGGSFYPEGRHDFERRPFALIGGDFVQQTREVLQHELTHLFVHYYYPQAPTWLNEGLAQYMETMAFEDGKVVLGRQSARQRFWKGPRQYHADPTGGTSLIPMSDAPSPGALRGMSPAEFYDKRDLDPRTTEGIEAAQIMAAHYAAAWSLVHMLLTSDTYAEAFGVYLGRIHEGAREGAAWQDAFGRLPEEQITKDYQAALVPKEVTLIRAKWASPAFTAENVRPMTSSEVHVLWARLRPDTPEGRRAAEADLAEARRGGPAEMAADVALVQAYWLAMGKQNADAEVELREALARRAEDPRLWNALGGLVVEDTADATGHVSPEGQKALAPIADHLAPIAKSAAQFDLLANISSVGGKPDAALAYEKRAVALDPNCVSCLGQAANILYAKGLPREALETATLALGLAPEGRRMPRLLELIETCRRKLAEGSAPANDATQPGGGVSAPASSASRSSRAPANRGSSPTR
jgi:tetratricopeptide (TPR) repeat protein